MFYKTIKSQKVKNNISIIKKYLSLHRKKQVDVGFY